MTKNVALVRIFGSNLRKYRNKRGLSQRALYHLSGIDNGMLSRMENGQVNVTLNTLSILARTLNVPCSELLLTTDDDRVLEKTQSASADGSRNN